MANLLNELIKFIKINGRLDLKSLAIENILGLTGTDDGIVIIINNEQLLKNLINLLINEDNNLIRKDTALILVNVSGNEKGAKKLINLNYNYNDNNDNSDNNIIEILIKLIFDCNCTIADPCCMILSNLTRSQKLNDQICDILQKSLIWDLNKFINIFTLINYNKKGQNLNYLGSILSNLSQNQWIRTNILNKNENYLLKILPFINYEDSLIRRGGVIGTIKNCCFEIDYHEWLLDDNNDFDLLSYLLLPLAGNEEFDDDDDNKLPIDLQYLPITKQRESDSDLRHLLIEIIMKLCTKRINRTIIRDKNTYIILRELHKWEPNSNNQIILEDLINILIRTENEIGLDNLNSVEIPTDIMDKFKNTKI